MTSIKTVDGGSAVRRRREELGAILSVAVEPQGVTVSTAHLDEAERRWLEAFRVGAITADELRAYREDIRRERSALSAPRVRRVDLGQYAEVARELSDDELVALLGARVTLKSREDIELDLQV